MHSLHLWHVLFILTHSLHFQCAFFIPDVLSLSTFPSGHLKICGGGSIWPLTSSGCPLLFILSRPPHNMWWWVHMIPCFGGLPFTFLFLPDHLTTWGSRFKGPLVLMGCLYFDSHQAISQHVMAGLYGPSFQQTGSFYSYPVQVC